MEKTKTSKANFFFCPACNFLGFALGKISGLLGDKYAMACTAAVEEVIDDH